MKLNEKKQPNINTMKKKRLNKIIGKRTFGVVTIKANKTAFAYGFIGIIGQIVGIKVYKLPVFIIWQIGKMAFNRQITKITESIIP